MRASYDTLGEGLDPVSILLVDDREENLVALEAVLRGPSYKLIKTHVFKKQRAI